MEDTVDRDSVYRSRVTIGGVVVAILPTWSDGALVWAALAHREDVLVEDGEWHGCVPGHRLADAPEPTHRGAHDFLALLAQEVAP
jgi:hypothetical protein